MDVIKWDSWEKMNCFILEGVALIDFNAPWSRPCRAQAGIIHSLEKQFQGKAKVLAVNIDESQRLAFSLGIQSIPTTIIFKDGHEVQRFIGLQSAKTLENSLIELLS